MKDLTCAAAQRRLQAFHDRELAVAAKAMHGLRIPPAADGRQHRPRAHLLHQPLGLDDRLLTARMEENGDAVQQWTLGDME